MPNFMEILPVATPLIRAYRRTDGYDESDRRFSRLCRSVWKKDTGDKACVLRHELHHSPFCLSRTEMNATFRSYYLYTKHKQFPFRQILFPPSERRCWHFLTDENVINEPCSRVYNRIITGQASRLVFCIASSDFRPHLTFLEASRKEKSSQWLVLKLLYSP
jgi:hypothetical protein